MPKPRELHDEYFKRAKAEGFVARSAYKLMEIDDKKRLLPWGGAVLDLGCAPGSWLQVACERVGEGGRVVGIDLQEVTIERRENLVTLVGDIFKTPTEAFLEHAGGGRRRFQTVLSDMAPNTSGHGDDLLSARLCRRVLELLPGLLAQGGSMCMKIFEGSECPDVIRETRAMFAAAGVTKPRASRDVSRETYIYGKGFSPPSGQAPRRSDVAPPAPTPGPGWRQ
jgi:23S rRNA (uridine2552-2'-O)-methyltransferase